MIKLIASDIDGTLVKDGCHDINPELYDVILKLREKGIQFAAASGRQWVSIESIFDPIKEKISYALTQIKKQAQTNAQIALGRAELTAARVSFIVEQISPSYDASGKNTVKPSGGLFNSKT